MVTRIITSKTASDAAARLRDTLDPMLSATGHPSQAKALFCMLKPNWIQAGCESRPEDWRAVITDPGLVLTVSEITAELYRGNGRLIIADSPNTYASFSDILQRGNLGDRVNELSSKYMPVHLGIMDLRREVWKCVESVVVERKKNKPDPGGYVVVNLGRDSMFYGYKGEGRYYGADYDRAECARHHSAETHEYLLSGSAMACDIFINLPKLKTHKKTGITCALKNLVGINGDKNWLPHFVTGSPVRGGDEYPDAGSKGKMEGALKGIGQRIALRWPLLGGWLYRKGRRAGLKYFGESSSVIRGGNWNGNDTCWRMVLDLNRAFLYGRPDGSMGDRKRTYFCIVDAMVAGEGNGPLDPEPVEMGLLVAGENAAEIDAVCCRLMGFDPREIPLVREAFAAHRYPLNRCKLEDVRVFDERAGREIGISEVEPGVQGGCRPHFGWAGLRKDAVSVNQSRENK